MFLCLLLLERSALAALRKDLRNTVRSAYSVGTFVNLKTQFKAYLLFCWYFRLTPAPAELDTICLYVQCLSRTLTPPSVRNYFSGGKLFHLFSGLEFPYTKDFFLSLTLWVSLETLFTPRVGRLQSRQIFCFLFLGC